MLKVSKATIDDKRICINTLSMAFDNDPVINWFIRQDKKRCDALNTFFEISFKDLTLPFGHVFKTADNNGVALWTPPGKWQLAFFDQIKLLPGYFKAFDIKRIHKVIPSIQRMQSFHPEFPHYYLFALGVVPIMQNRGLGSSLLKEVLNKCDKEKLPAYLEATSPSNRDLYIRHGFSVIRKFKLSPQGPEMWFMLREPQSILQAAV